MPHRRTALATITMGSLVVARSAEAQRYRVQVLAARSPSGIADHVRSLEALVDPPPGTALSRARVVVTVAGRLESNIDHEEDPLSAWGLITGVGLVYGFESDDTDLELSYEVARHHYASAPRWNRIGHTARAALERELGGPWTLKVTGEASLGGTTEDRELADVYSLRPRLEFELGDGASLRLNTAFRLKRFDGEPDRNATSPYVGLEFKQYLGSGVSWSVGSRYGLKQTPSERRRYRRWTSEAELALPVPGGSRVELGVKYRVNNYTHRLVELDDELEVLRRDRRIQPSFSWVLLRREEE